MILEAVFTYNAEVMAPRKRTAKPRILSGSMPVEIAEITAGQAPVALRTATEAGKREYLWDGERLLTAVEKGPSARIEDHTDHRTLTRESALGDPLRLQAGYSRHKDAPFPQDDPMVARIVKSNIDERKRQVAAAAARFVLVGGVLHEEAPEPVYCVANHANIFEPRNWVLELDSMKDVADCGMRHFRADERETALASQETVEDDGSLIEVLVPEACRAPMPEAALLVVAREVIDEMKDGVLEGSVAFFEAYAKVRDCASSLREAIALGHRNERLSFAGSNLSLSLTTAVPELGHLDKDLSWNIERVVEATGRHDGRLDLLELAGLDEGPQPARR